MMTNKTVLVTGGAGYIGSHACKILSKNGFTPVSFDNLVYGHEWAVQWGPLEQGDLSDRSRLEELFTAYDFTAVMHFAAFAYVGESITNPAKYYRNNVMGTLNLLETMCAHDVKQMVFSSTCATYGEPEVTPIAESHPQRPINPYGASKLMVERILADFEQAYGVRYVALRYFNAAGADPDCDIGEDHDPETHLIPLVLDVATGKSSDVSIYGDDYDTPDGTCIRDYVHVCDLANAHVLALKSLQKGADSRIYNLGNGAGYSIREVIDAARRISGEDISVRIGSRRSGDPARLVGNARRICDELGWEPKYPDLDSIMKTAWEWHKLLPEKRG